MEVQVEEEPGQFSGFVPVPSVFLHAIHEPIPSFRPLLVHEVLVLDNLRGGGRCSDHLEYEPFVGV